MAVNSIKFADTPGKAVAQVSVANTNRDGTGTVATILAGVALGRYIRKITVKAVATSTAGMVRLYFYDGTNTRLIREVAVSAITASASVKTFEEEILFSDLDAPILVGTTQELRASTHNAETFNIHVDYADFTS